MNRQIIIDTFYPPVRDLYRKTGVKLTIVVRLPREFFDLVLAEQWAAYGMLPPVFKPLRIEINSQLVIEEA